MKYFTLLFSLAIIGCELPISNSVRILFKDSTVRSFELLSVRDTAIIAGQQVNESTQRAYLVPIKDIDRVYHDNVEEKTGWMFKGAAIGAGATVIAALMYGIDRGAKFNEQGVSQGAIGVAFLSIPSVIVGGILGYVIPDNEVPYDPSDPSDRNSLRRHAKYTPHGEPTKIRDLGNPK